MDDHWSLSTPVRQYHKSANLRTYKIWYISGPSANVSLRIYDFWTQSNCFADLKLPKKPLANENTGFNCFFYICTKINSFKRDNFCDCFKTYCSSFGIVSSEPAFLFLQCCQQVT